MSLLSEWRRTRDIDTITKHPVNAESIGWTKPRGRWIKINVDAALCWDQYIGVEVVIRDSNGQFKRARCCRIVENGSFGRPRL